MPPLAGIPPDVLYSNLDGLFPSFGKLGIRPNQHSIKKRTSKEKVKETSLSILILKCSLHSVLLKDMQ
jgi:hypothetical protein